MEECNAYCPACGKEFYIEWDETDPRCDECECCLMRNEDGDDEWRDDNDDEWGDGYA